MLGEDKFTLLTYVNVNDLYTSGTLKKGSLIRYKFSDFGIMDYGLDCDDNDWHYGLISETLWYVNMSRLSLEPHKESVCYDLSVHNITLGGTKEVINMELYDIYLLKSE